MIDKAVPFTLEADSLNACILGESVEPGDEEFSLFIKEVAREMTSKAGQKCTAIRRAVVPRDKVEAVVEALRERLERSHAGRPRARRRADGAAGECRAARGGFEKC